jgi:hypothetical protein
MPTVIDPQIKEEPKPKLVPPPSNEPELFAAEIAMEKQGANFFPLLLIGCLVFVVGGTIFYFVKGARDVLTAPVATTTITQFLDAQGPATIRFTVGTVTSSVNEKPLDPQYKLLSKAGVVTTKPKGASALIVTLTAPGEKLLSAIEGVQKNQNPDGSTTYLVPLAARKLVSIDKVTMVKPHLAQVEYTWKWDANRLGSQFEASGALVKSFTTWDRATLIKSYGVDFYSAPPSKAGITLMEKDNGSWKPYTE